MERKCGNCLIWKQYNKVCPFFKEEMKEDSPACPKFTDTVKFHLTENLPNIKKFLKFINF